MKNVVIAIKVDQRSAAAPTVQEVLTRYGDIIHFRLGMHGLHRDGDSEHGRIILQVIGEADKVDGLQQALDALDMVKVQAMELE